MMNKKPNSMKKIIYTFVILFISQLNFANELDSILSKAREFGKQKNYTEAIKAYESYIKNAGDENLKEVFVEVANCYFLDGKKEVAPTWPIVPTFCLEPSFFHV